MATNHSFLKTVIISAPKEMVFEFFQDLFNDANKKKNITDVNEIGETLSFKMVTSGLFKSVTTSFELTFGDSSGRVRLQIKTNSDGDAEKAARELIKDLQKRFQVAG